MLRVNYLELLVVRQNSHFSGVKLVMFMSKSIIFQILLNKCQPSEKLKNDFEQKPTAVAGYKEPQKCERVMTPFFRRTGTSVQVSGKVCQNIILHVGLILKLRDAEIGLYLFLGNY